MTDTRPMDPRSIIEEANLTAPKTPTGGTGTPKGPNLPPPNGGGGNGNDPFERAPSSTGKWLFLGLLALILLLGIGLLALKFTGQKISQQVTVSAPTPAAGSPASAPATDPTRNGGKLILAEMCTLHSDGTAITIESQIAYKAAKAAFAKKEISEAMLREHAEAAKPRPAHEVIAEVPSSMLAEGETCDRWRQVRASQLVLGVRAPKS